MSTSQLTNYAKQAYQKTINSIAFYPTLLSVGMLGVAWICLHIDSVDAISYDNIVIKFLSFLVVKNTETARSLLALLAGGLISLMVFSFSMVMIVLNQTASNYSPRVLPGLVSRREHQLVLGVFLGTIGYTLAVLSNVDSQTFGVLVPRFSIIVNLLLAIGCFASFIYFIHDTSNIIQVGNIIKRLYRQTHSSLIREISESEYVQRIPQVETNYQVNAWESGYFFSVVEEPLLRKAEQLNLHVRILINQGQYIVKGEPFLEVNLPITDKVQKLLTRTFIFRNEEMITENFFYGFKQITEVAVKALSPGINDPGTAIMAIDYLTDLFLILLQLKGQRVLRKKNETPSLIFLPVPSREIFYFSVSSLRNYAEVNITVQAKLIYMIKVIEKYDTNTGNKNLYQGELEGILSAAKKSFTSEKDVEYIQNLILREL